MFDISEAVIGQSVTLVCKAHTTQKDNIGYSWYRSGVKLNNRISSSFLIENVTKELSSSYQCMTSNSFGKTMSELFTFKVHGIYINIILFSFLAFKAQHNKNNYRKY